MKTIKNISTATLVLAAALAAPSQAAITSWTGSTTYLGTPPTSCTPGSLTGFTAYAWNEQQNFTTTGLYMDDTMNPGGNASPVPGTLPGTYASHFIHFEPLPGAVGAVGSVTFSDPIVGIMFVNTSLDNSDALCGAGGTTYPTTFPFRGLNSASTVSYLGNTLNFNIWVAVPTNDVAQIRVITHTNAPAPGATALLGLGGLCMTRRRRTA